MDYGHRSKSAIASERTIIGGQKRFKRAAENVSAERGAFAASGAISLNPSDTDAMTLPRRLLVCGGRIGIDIANGPQPLHRKSTGGSEQLLGVLIWRVP
jgi:hypothetical protein